MTVIPIPAPYFSEELLRDPQALRIILDAADIPINYCSADRRFLFVNRTYAAWYGKTPEQIIGRSLVDLLGEEGHETIRPYYERALRGEHFKYETEVNLSIGYRYIQCSYTPVTSEDGTVTGWVGIVYDMTQRYLMEQALHENEQALKLAKEKAETANIAKSEFMATMSHEIRTPMNAVLGLAHILSMSQPLTPKQTEYIHTLRLSAQSLLSLINDLLDFSKTESGGIDLEHIPFRFSSIIDEIIAMFAVQAREKGISIEYKKSPADDTSFLGDPLRVRQILTNLISNAVKFTHQGGITIETSITPSAGPDSAYAHVTVSDTGIGIPESKLAAIFDKFMQADMSITRQYGGSGLGLAISKNLAELMGGSIMVKSTPGVGAVFSLHLPLDYAGENTARTALPRREKISVPLPQKNISILLAEDHQPNILVATTLLESMGYRCDVARTGKEVLGRLNGHHPYDIVLMDVQMPELDGYAATQLIRENERKSGHKRMPIIGVTAHVMPDSVERCFKAGMDDYVGKPFDPETLRQKIAGLLRNT